MKKIIVCIALLCAFIPMQSMIHRFWPLLSQKIAYSPPTQTGIAHNLENLWFARKNIASSLQKINQYDKAYPQTIHLLRNQEQQLVQQLTTESNPYVRNRLSSKLNTTRTSLSNAEREYSRLSTELQKRIELERKEQKDARKYLALGKEQIVPWWKRTQQYFGFSGN